MRLSRRRNGQRALCGRIRCSRLPAARLVLSQAGSSGLEMAKRIRASVKIRFYRCAEGARRHLRGGLWNQPSRYEVQRTLIPASVLLDGTIVRSVEMEIFDATARRRWRPPGRRSTASRPVIRVPLVVNSTIPDGSCSYAGPPGSALCRSRPGHVRHRRAILSLPAFSLDRA